MKKLIYALAGCALLLFSCSSFVEDLHTDAVPTASGSISVKTDYDEHNEFTIKASRQENSKIYHVYVSSYPTGFVTINYEWWLDGTSVQSGAQEYYDWNFTDASAGNHSIMLIVSDSAGVEYSTSIQLPVKKD